MKKIFSVMVILFSVLVVFQATGNTATSSLDNLPGGAGIAYWQAGAGWETLVNIQETAHQCALLHIELYNRDGDFLYSFNMSLRPSDNVGIVVQGDGTNIQVFDYSDNAYGGSAALNDVNVGPPIIFFSPADTDGIQRGYITVVKTNTGCSGTDGTPSGNIAGMSAIVADNLLIRTALINPNNAFAFNGAMLQGFANIAGNISETSDFTDSSEMPNSVTACDFNNDGDTIDSFASLDDINGAEIDFAELFLTDNVTQIAPRIICDSPAGQGDPENRLYKALGSSNDSYCGRYNMDPAVGTETNLIIVAPQSSHASGFQRNITAVMYDDDTDSVSWGKSFNVVGVIPLSEFPIFTSGELCFTTSVPVFGFTYTETASFADIYPLMKRQVAVSSLNEDEVDDDIDVIMLP